jgi:transcriptional regulator with XRE-family HTH domain
VAQAARISFAPLAAQVAKRPPRRERVHRCARAGPRLRFAKAFRHARRPDPEVALGRLAGARDSRSMNKIPDPIDIHVGARLRMRRMMVAMSQEKLGAALGITFQQIQKYEKGANRIGASRLQQIANILQVPPAFFFEEAPAARGPSAGFAEPAPAAYSPDVPATAEGLQLNRAFAQIRDPKVRRRILDLVVSLAQESTQSDEDGAL